ncbi:MAG: hypothetical protein JWR37_5890 [Mycobacterium sp.]|jgi:hypothetical protein|nr:hypothetical protein [Mycobacterium sp.]
MTACAQLTSALLNEAAAIVEAEWMRLIRRDEPPAGLISTPALDRVAPRGRLPLSTTTSALSGAPSPTGHPAQRGRRSAPERQVWATQRSPPHSALTMNAARRR